MIGQSAVEGVEYSISDTCVPAAFITGLLPQVAEARANNNRNPLTRTDGRTETVPGREEHPSPTGSSEFWDLSLVVPSRTAR